MKKLLQLASLCVLLSGLVVSCDNKETRETVDTPANLTVGNLTATTAELSWKPVAGVDKYQLTLNDAEPVFVTDAFYLASSLKPASKYAWKVQALKDNADSQWADGPEFTTNSDDTDGKMAPPTGLTVSNLTRAGATLSWQHPDAASHEISIDNGRSISVSTTSYTVTGLSAGTSHHWIVRSTKNGIWSKWAYGPEFTTNSGGTDDETAPPTGLTVSNLTKDGATLSWQHPDAASHEISIDNGRSIPVSNTTYKVTGLVAGTAHNWKVRSTKNGLWSKWVNGDPFTTNKDGDGNRIMMTGMYNFMYYRNYKGLDVFDAWVVGAYQKPDVYLDGDYLKGNGFFVNIQFHAAPNSGPHIPNGTYTFDDSGQPGTVLSGFEDKDKGAEAGTWLGYLENDEHVASRLLVSGQVTTNCVKNSDGSAVYIIKVDAKSHKNENVRITIDTKDYSIRPTANTPSKLPLNREAGRMPAWQGLTEPAGR